MLIDSVKVIYTMSQELPVITTREELKKDSARLEGNFNFSGVEKNRGRLKKR